MSTSTIDHSPVSHEQQPVAPTTVRAVGERAVVHSNHEAEPNDLHERMSILGAIIRKNTHIHLNFEQLAKKDPTRRGELLLRHHTLIEEPLMQLYEEYSRDHQPLDKFVGGVVGVQPHTTLSPQQKQYLSVVNATLKHGLAIRQLREVFDACDVPYATPTEDDIKAGIDLYVKDQPLRFRLSSPATSLIHAPIDGVRRVTLPSPLQDGPSNTYGTPPLSKKQLSRIGDLFSISVQKYRQQKQQPTGTKQKSEKPTEQAIPERSASTQVVVMKPKSAKQIAHEQRMKEARELAQARIAKKRAAEDLARQTQVLKSLTIGTPGHGIGTDRGYVEPPYATKEERESLKGEQYALAIIDEALGDQVIDGYKVTPLKASKLITSSIRENDPREIQVLKTIAAKLCIDKDGHVDNANDLLTLADSCKSSELRDFIAHIYTWSHPDSHDTDKIIANFMNLSGGFRVEASFIKLARKAGHDVEPATREQDYAGTDCVVDGVPFNVKSSTRHAKKYARQYSGDQFRSRIVKFVPPFKASDFAGELIIPDDRLDEILEESSIREMINQAVGIYLGEYRGLENMSRPDTRATTSEQVQLSEIDRELDKLALNASRHWRRKVKKAATERWG